MADALESAVVGLFLMVGFAVVAALYFLPSIVVLVRRSDTAGAVLVTNLFLGWTFLGWVTSLAMAVSGTIRPRPVRPAVYPASCSYPTAPQLKSHYHIPATTNGVGSGHNGRASVSEVASS